MRGLRKGAIWALLILLAAGHVAYWYWPREHPGAPTSDSPVAALMATEDLELRVWVAYPHQNLAFLSSAESGANWRAGLAQLSDVPEIELPGFGPFPLPPASELAVATDSSGRRLRVAARIYPAISWIARAAGKVADNPWLAGGVVDDGDRQLVVAWEGRTWTLHTPDEAWGAGGTVADSGDSLARFSLREPVDPLPAGDYRLIRSGAHLDLLSVGANTDGLVEPDDGALKMTERRSRGLRASAVLGPGQGSLRGIPSAVVFAQRGVALPELPFEKLYRLLGIKRREATVGDWRLVASDRLALTSGRELVPGLQLAAEGGGVGLAYSVDLDVVRGVSESVEKALEGLPPLPIPEIDRWRGAALLLGELGAYDRWTLEVDADGRQARSRLWHSD